MLSHGPRRNVIQNILESYPRQRKLPMTQWSRSYSLDTVQVSSVVGHTLNTWFWHILTLPQLIEKRGPPRRDPCIPASKRHFEGQEDITTWILIPKWFRIIQNGVLLHTWLEDLRYLSPHDAPRYSMIIHFSGPLTLCLDLTLSSLAFFTEPSVRSSRPEPKPKECWHRRSLWYHAIRPLWDGLSLPSANATA